MGTCPSTATGAAASVSERAAELQTEIDTEILEVESEISERMFKLALEGTRRCAVYHPESWVMINEVEFQEGAFVCITPHSFEFRDVRFRTTVEILGSTLNVAAGAGHMALQTAGLEKAKKPEVKPEYHKAESGSKRWETFEFNCTMDLRKEFSEDRVHCKLKDIKSTERFGHPFCELSVFHPLIEKVTSMKATEVATRKAKKYARKYLACPSWCGAKDDPHVGSAACC